MFLMILKQILFKEIVEFSLSNLTDFFFTNIKIRFKYFHWKFWENYIKIFYNALKLKNICFYKWWTIAYEFNFKELFLWKNNSNCKKQFRIV